ncbi:EamA family transporter [Paenibacillus sp. LMG 31456]|uniref:EamA family transporter n=1 Tax=Paenibacillus foliorum TaxID=2654974 RepID=A0A972GRS9_9BACL|nr:DMT family transporter [Paenibacillus foliorum]NOU93284.1 EamA family transporter [Paenibacillus foliorum]
MIDQKKLSVHPYFLLLISVLAVAVSSIMIKSSLAPTSVAGMYRLFITVVIMLPFVPWRIIKTIHLKAKDWVTLIFVGILLGLHFLFWMESLRYTSVASSMVILTLQPFFVMMGSYYMFKERVTLPISLCMVAAVVGSIVIAWGDIGVSRTALYGDLLSLLGTIAISIYMLAGQKISNRIPANIYSVFVFFLGGVVMLVYSVANNYSLTDYQSSEWLYFMLLAVIPTIFGHFIFNLLLKHVGATTVSVGVIGEPVLAIMLAYVFLGEMIGPSQFVGGLLTIVGMGMYFWLKSKEEAL